MRLVSVVTEDAQALVAHVAALGEEIVDLVLDGADDDFGVDEARGADHLLDEDATRPLELP